IVKAVNKLRNLKQQPEEEEVPEVTAEDYLEEIRDLLKAQTPTANTVDPRPTSLDDTIR
ncbi:TPA: large conductance mechanosensitive channel protein MscL, partial [Salmonella enterica]|nr:large conductance mechanosensitive channel protein MscL [Salmonella enterica]